MTVDVRSQYSAEEIRLLEMGPVLKLLIEHVPRVEKRSMRGIEWLMGSDPRVVRYTNHNLQEIAQNVPEFLTLQRLVMHGLIEETSREPRWDLEPPKPDPHMQAELKSFERGRRARGDYTQVTWRRTEKGEALLKQLNPPPKPKYRLKHISDNECELEIIA